MHKTVIHCYNDAFHLYNESHLGLPDYEPLKGNNEIYYSMLLDHSSGYWGTYESGDNSFYHTGGYLTLVDYSYVHARNNFWNPFYFDVDETSAMDYLPILEEDPNKVPAGNIADLEVEQLFLEAQKVSLKNPEKSWDMFIYTV